MTKGYVFRRSLNAWGLARIGRKILVERTAWRQALGVPEGFKISKKPLPTTREELEAELAEVGETGGSHRSTLPQSIAEPRGRHPHPVHAGFGIPVAEAARAEGEVGRFD
jgi:hypothetical protein